MSCVCSSSSSCIRRKTPGCTCIGWCVNSSVLELWRGRQTAISQTFNNCCTAVPSNLASKKPSTQCSINRSPSWIRMGSTVSCVSSRDHCKSDPVQVQLTLDVCAQVVCHMWKARASVPKGRLSFCLRLPLVFGCEACIPFALVCRSSSCPTSRLNYVLNCAPPAHFRKRGNMTREQNGRHMPTCPGGFASPCVCVCVLV